MSTQPTATLTGLALLALATACGGPTGPEFQPIDDQVVAVGVPLELPLQASSGSGGAISYAYQSNDSNLGDRVSLTQRPDGTGLFTWTPNAQDVGTWVFDFSATDANGNATESVTIEVRSAVGAASMPIFRRPLGSGTAIKMTSGTCVDIAMAATDQDSTRVTFAEEEPKIEGAEMLQEADFDATWHWCPTDTQVQAQDRYLLTLSADDGQNPKAIKRYQVILRGPEKTACQGTPPVISHTAADQTTLDGLKLSAQLTDDKGLKAAPLLYYSADQPADQPDLSKMTQLTMVKDSGDTISGTWSIEVPNPIAAGGLSATVYYAIVAEDNDDSGGTCDHLVTQSYSMKVSNPGGDGQLGICQPCTADTQCGGAADNCLQVGTQGQAFCLTACDDTPGSCGDGYVCSKDLLTSVDGAKARQCVPLDEKCDLAPACPEDGLEQNDSRSQAADLATGTTENLRMCPVGTLGSDEDWFAITVTESSTVTVKIAGNTYPNMELALEDDTGKLLAASEDWGSDDDVTRCLAPGKYFARVYSYFSGDNTYSVTISQTPAATCDTGGTCQDDPFEDDDNMAQARVPDLETLAYNTTANAICAGDDDWFFVHLFGDESVFATLKFAQAAPTQDLDLLVYDGTGAIVTKCTEQDPSGCDPANGQSSDANETMTFTAPSESDYYVVVHGWEGSENTYDLCMSLDTNKCAAP